MEVTWDPAKARENFRSHKIHFADAEAALFDSNALSFEDKDSEGESRFVAIGRDSLDRLVVVVYTYRNDTVRLISVRRAKRKEIRDYEEGI